MSLKSIVIVGASGFIGEHLLSLLSKRNDTEVRGLVHRTQVQSAATNIQFFHGDLLKPDSLDKLLNTDCTVINLAMLAQNNLEAMINLAEACTKNKIKRLIHCSTAVVVGRTSNELVTESTICNPISEYEKTKLQIENKLLEISMGKYEFTILRPTAVFGPGGKNLLKLANELTTASRISNDLKSYLFNHRSMNLVCVDNVVAALDFLTDAKKVDREIFIISDDDSPMNNYLAVQQQLLAYFGKKNSLPRVFLPKPILSIALRLAGKKNINPSIKYSDQKLAGLGFKKTQNLEKALNIFSQWYKNTHLNLR